MKTKRPHRTKCCLNCDYFRHGWATDGTTCSKDYMAEIDYDYVCWKHRYVRKEEKK